MAEKITRNQEFLNLFKEQQAPGPGDTEGFINLFRGQAAEPEEPGLMSRIGGLARSAAETAIGLPPESVVPGAEPVEFTPPPDTLGPTLGEILGFGAGAALGPAAPIAAPALASLGAAGGLAAERFLTGRPQPTPTELGTEAALSAVPEIAEPVLRSIGRGLLKGGSVTGRIAENLRAGQALGTPQEIFEPITRQELDVAFDSVRQSGHTVAPQPFLPIRKLDDDEFNAIVSVVRPIGGGRNFLPDLGKQFARKLEAIRKGGPRAGFDLGELQHVRSELLKAADRPGQKRVGAIDEAIDLIDDAVDSGLTIGKKPASSQAAPLQLMHARRQWAKHKAAEDMGELVRRSGLKVSADKGLMEIDLNRLATSIEFPKTKLEQRVAKDLKNLSKGGKEEMIGSIKRMASLGEPNLSVKTLNSFNVAGVHPIRLITDAFTTAMGRQAVERVLLREGKKGVDIRTFAMISNLVRRAGQAAIQPREERQQ